jgi:hypothetical protein
LSAIHLLNAQCSLLILIYIHTYTLISGLASLLLNHFAYSYCKTTLFESHWFCDIFNKKVSPIPICHITFDILTLEPRLIFQLQIQRPLQQSTRTPLWLSWVVFCYCCHWITEDEESREKLLSTSSFLTCLVSLARSQKMKTR